jgi:hypothetical protein
MLQGRTRNATLHRVLLAVVACGWVLLGPVAVGGGNDSDPPNPYRVLLHSREFVPKADVAKHLRSGERRGVLQFTELPGEERHVELQASGIVLHDYLPNLAYAATLGPSVNAHDLALLGVRAWFPLEPNDRLSADLRHGRIGAWARPAKHLVDVVILRYPDFAQDDAARAVAALGGVVLSTAEPFEQLTARLPMHDLRELARESWVLWIEAVPPPFVANNDRSRQSINVDAVQVPPYSLSGPGVRIAVFEDGSISHPDLAGRVTNHAVNLSAHATHVAGTLAGDGALSGGLLRGMAPKALLFAWTYVPPANVFASMLTSVTTEKTVISNNSWGANIGNAFNNCHLLGNYGAEANIFDRLVRNNKFATYKSAGNARTTLCAPLTYGTIDLTATAKNAVIVGATLRPAPNTADSTAYFSGWGPTDDGRLKPDVVAVGYPVKSTCLSFSYCELSGTSQATPAVSGTAALLMESYRNTHDNRDPSPELVKAILLNTAVDIGPAGPDFQSGYGKVDALRAVNTVRDERFLNGSVGPSQSRVINLTVANSPSCSFKVLMAYTDKEAAPNAAKALVNDLDLKLISPNGTTYLPLTLDPAPANRGALAVPGINTRDNVEQVSVPLLSSANPWPPGDWQAVVTGSKVPFGRQSFALTWDAQGPFSPCSVVLPAPGCGGGPFPDC